MKRLSIVIVTYNSERDIYDCLASIRRYSDIPKEELEVIVVDNCSQNVDAVFSRLSETYGDDIVLVKNTMNGGYGQGNNVGIRRASASVVLIMNPDVRLMEPVFATALAAFDQNANLCMYGLKQMLSPTERSTNTFTCSYMMNGYVSTFLSGICNKLDVYLQKYMHFSGACFFVDKAKFERIGLFDESVFLYGEEEDIHYRFKHTIAENAMVYNKHLRYIHLTKERAPDLKYEKTLVDVAVAHNRRKGYSARKTLENRLRNVRCLLLRERLRLMLGKNDRTLYDMLTLLQRYIKEQMARKPNKKLLLI